MCVPYRLRDPKTRFMMVLGNLALVAAVLSLNFMRHHIGEHPWLDGLSGLFFGLSIGANLMSIYRARHCRPAGGT